GSGLAGAAVAAPRIAGADGARVGSWPASAAGGLVGAAVFVGLIVFEARVPAPLTALREAPVLVAAPAAWLVVKLLRREARAARWGVARSPADHHNGDPWRVIGSSSVVPVSTTSRTSTSSSPGINWSS